MCVWYDGPTAINVTLHPSVSEKLALRTPPVNHTCKTLWYSLTWDIVNIYIIYMHNIVIVPKFEMASSGHLILSLVILNKIGNARRHFWHVRSVTFPNIRIIFNVV